MSTIETNVQRKLLSFYKRRHTLHKDIEIHGIRKISDGWENEVYSFRMEYEKDPEQKDLILRIYPGDYADRKAAREFNGMKKLHELGYPVPEVLILELDDSPFGKPFVIMERINGRSMRSVIDEASQEKKKELLALFCRMFVDLHTLDWRPFAQDPSIYEAGDPYAFINNLFSEAQGYIDRFQEKEFIPVLDWLKERYLDVPCERLSVVHLDYHPDNILLRDNGGAFVIDWTNIDVADFRYDLAWTILLISTYGIPGLRETVLGEYERVADCRIEQVEYFEVIASFRRLFSILVSLSAGADKLGMRPEAAAMMKEQTSHIENVYSILRNRTGITIPEIESLLSNL